MELEILRSRVPYLANAMKIEQIVKGFSSDRKLIIHTENGQKLILRVSKLEDYLNKKAEFEIIENMEKLEVNTSRCIDVGKLDDLGVCYQLLTYIEGEDARETISSYTKQQQFEIGRKAGRDLAKIHRLKAPLNVSSWYDRIIAKHQRYLDEYRLSNVKIKGDDRLIKFIADNEKILKNRPNHLQHDDFHLGNLLVKSGDYAGVIDFNRYDWGDPYHDFIKIGIFSKEISVPFCIGQVEGYFTGSVKDSEFWRIYSIYSAMMVFSSIVWTSKVVPEDLNNMLERLYNLLEDHKYFEYVEPSWYQ